MLLCCHWCRLPSSRSLCGPGWLLGLPPSYLFSHNRKKEAIKHRKQVYPRHLSAFKPNYIHFYFYDIFTVLCLVTQSCLTLCNPTDCSPPCSSVYGILQARILEWVAVPFSRDLPDPGIEPRSPALQADSLPSEPSGY